VQINCSPLYLLTNYCLKVFRARLIFPRRAWPTLIFSRVGGCPPCPPRAGAHGCGQMTAWIKMSLGMELSLSPGNFVLDGDPTALSPTRGGAPPPKKKLGPCSLWPNGWMAEAGPCHGGRPQTRRLCVRWGPSPLPQKGAEPPPQFSVHFYCGRIKMRLGMDVGLCPGDFAI